MKTKDELPVCPVATAVSLVGGKWKLLIIRNLRMRPWRFNELQRDLEGISQKVLTDSLRQMMDDGLVYRHDYQEMPPRVDRETGGQVKWLFSCSHWLSDIKFQIVPFENTQERAKNILLNFGKEIDVCGCIFDKALFGLGGFAWRAFYVDAAGMEHSGG